jgi:hypothetical protein
MLVKRVDERYLFHSTHRRTFDHGWCSCTLSVSISVWYSLNPRKKREKGGKWDRPGDVYRLPILLETLASTVFLLGGVGILAWAKFDHCAFLTHWLPDLPEALRLFLSCK